MIKKYLSLFCLFILSCVAINTANAGLFDKKTNYLTVEQAFPFSIQATPQKITLHWDILPNYYLYKHTITITSTNVDFQQQLMPVTEKTHEDPYFGKTQIFEQGLDVILTLTTGQFSPQGQLQINYQGCTEGLCYPPQQQQIDLAQVIKVDSHNSVDTTATPSLTEQLFQSKFAVFWFFLLGIGLAFTPCVLPMLPLLSAIVIGKEQRVNTGKALLLSFIYVQGMALTYALLGLAVAAVGLSLQVWLQSPYVLGAFAILFVLLACSMFGLFTLQLPTSWQTKLTALSQQQSAGMYGGVFLMGAIAGLIASPCTSAPLSGALLYVTQTGDLATGALTLYLLALGMGTPLIAITVFGNKILPKSGAWMENVKIAFGFVLLALPIILLARFLPAYWEDILWSLLGIAFFAWLMTLAEKHSRIWQVLAMMAMIIAAAPLYFTVQQFLHPASSQSTDNDQFITVKDLQELQQQLRNNPHKIAMVDLYADWCVACKEFEHKTFNQPQVQQRLQQVLLLRVDMTKNSAANQALSKEYRVLGLPTILFFDQQGKEIPNSRVTGFLDAEQFSQWLDQLSGKQGN
ncbi:thiol:disulfide interchange protein [Gallibacterium salpingitidis]|uniref:protein-disulfide reductase DsbD n=1 Tax=Gallibacterium salpingitidis TaxID=505341 RepID=UPI000804C733|nr:protein-disulfide reductase DsbD [Gallibacterium salpingitidis]OBX07317.1 thiol:disulfide interchange protein [Gallibacterium salpingitidis]